jgi:hypothetical protein
MKVDESTAFVMPPVGRLCYLCHTSGTFYSNGCFYEWQMLKLFTLKNKRIFYQRRVNVLQIEIIEQSVKQLSTSELSAFRAWFIDFDAAAWDRQLETDSETGKLDKLAKNALREHRAGKTKLI